MSARWLHCRWPAAVIVVIAVLLYSCTSYPSIPTASTQLTAAQAEIFPRVAQCTVELPLDTDATAVNAALTATATGATDIAAA